MHLLLISKSVSSSPQVFHLWRLGLSRDGRCWGTLHQNTSLKNHLHDSVLQTTQAHMAVIKSTETETWMKDRLNDSCDVSTSALKMICCFRSLWLLFESHSLAFLCCPTIRHLWLTNIDSDCSFHRWHGIESQSICWWIPEEDDAIKGQMQVPYGMSLLSLTTKLAFLVMCPRSQIRKDEWKSSVMRSLISLYSTDDWKSQARGNRTGNCKTEGKNTQDPVEGWMFCALPCSWCQSNLCSLL